MPSGSLANGNNFLEYKNFENSFTGDRKPHYCQKITLFSLFASHYSSLEQKGAEPPLPIQ
jgi:hypothetical protein